MNSQLYIIIFIIAVVVLFLWCKNNSEHFDKDRGKRYLRRHDPRGSYEGRFPRGKQYLQEHPYADVPAKRYLQEHDLSGPFGPLGPYLQYRKSDLDIDDLTCENVCYNSIKLCNRKCHKENYHCRIDCGEDAQCRDPCGPILRDCQDDCASSNDNRIQNCLTNC